MREGFSNQTVNQELLSLSSQNIPFILHRSSCLRFSIHRYTSFSSCHFSHEDALPELGELSFVFAPRYLEAPLQSHFDFDIFGKLLEELRHLQCWKFVSVKLMSRTRYDLPWFVASSDGGFGNLQTITSISVCPSLLKDL